MHVLYEDNHLLVVEKPVNVPVQPDASGDRDLLTILKDYIKQKYNKPGEVYLGLVHRLDRPVGGVMVFARTSKAAARLAGQFRGRSAKKSYLALTTGPAPYYEALEHYLLKDGATNTVRVVPPETPQAKKAALSFRLAACEKGMCLLDVALATGRSHQIRVQLVHRGLPVWGDARYNPAAKPGQQIALWAYALALEHPTTQERLRFVSLPAGGPWGAFAGALSSVSGQVTVVYADEDMIACNKPQGMTCTVADGPGGTLEEYVAQRYGEVLPVHRLDANTGGLVLLARNEAARAALAAMLADGRIRKRYRAILRGRPHPAAAVCSASLTKDAGRARVRVFDQPVPGSKPIRTGYRVLCAQEDLCLVELELMTGRTHQLRAHMAHLGHPVLGDEKYGDWALNKRYGLRRQALWAVELEFAPSPEFPRWDGLVLRSNAPFAICSNLDQHF